MDHVELFLGIVRLGVGLLLVVSAYGKLAQRFSESVSDVLGYRLVGRRSSEVVAFVLPVVEMFLSLPLLTGLFRPVSVLVAAAFLALLAAAAASALARGLVTDCGCWGSLARTRVSLVVVVRNLVLSVLLVADGLVAAHPRLVWVEPMSLPACQGTAVCVVLLLLQRWSQRSAERQPA